MSSLGNSAAVPVIARTPRIRRRCLRPLLFLLVVILSACGTTNSESPFDSEGGQHAADWANPLAIGRSDFHAGTIKTVQPVSTGAVLFGSRCALCHGDGGTGKIGPDIR